MGSTNFDWILNWRWNIEKVRITSQMVLKDGEGTLEAEPAT